MKGFGKLYWLPVLALLVVCMAACSPPAAEDCHGDLHVEQDEVARVTPSPREEYQISQTYTWDIPPYGVEVTSGGEAVMQIYAASNILLAKYTIYAATSTNGNVSVKKWDGLSEITFDAGNFIVEGSFCFHV